MHTHGELLLSARQQQLFVQKAAAPKGLTRCGKKLTTDKLNKEDKATYLRHPDNLSNHKSFIFTAEDFPLI
jgi:hypothetical protein